jgi:uncharacterized protein (DUF952 family)
MITHITTAEAWESAQASGWYRAASLETEGFIHLSRPEQLLATAERYYAGRADLVVLFVDPQRCSAELKTEPVVRPTGEVETFPHLYGPLETSAAVSVRPLELDAEGRFLFPADTPRDG